MKKYLLIISLLLPLFALSQTKTKEPKAVKPVVLSKNKVVEIKPAEETVNNLDKAEGRNWAFGVQLGTDIGGAIPFPFKYIPSTFNPYPKLNVAVGARISKNFTQRWSLHLEATYKAVAMAADARVENQRFAKDGETQYFSGSAKMNMSFTMMEFPLYAKWSASRKYNDFILIGPYFAYNLSQTFVTTAYKGYIGGKPDEVAGVVTPENQTVMDFSGYLGSWDMGVMVGYERRVWNRANVGIRVSMGFKDIFRPDARYFDYKMFQMRGTIFLEYDLFRLR